MQIHIRPRHYSDEPVRVLTLRFLIEKLLLTALLLATGIANAAGLKSRPATPEDYVGYWQLIPVQNDAQPMHIKNPPFQAKCTFFIHGQDHKWKYIEISNGAGEEETINHCPTNQTDLNQFVVFKNSEFVWQQVPRNPYFYLAKSEKLVFPWKVNFIEEDFPTAIEKGFPALLKGDLMIQLWDIKTNASQWVLILRRVERNLLPQTNETLQ